jgi:uncharacterized protein (TIGR03437 family)
VPRFLFLLAICQLHAQLIVDTYAGGVIRSGVPANSVAIPTINGLAWDPSGDIVFCDANNNVIRRIRPNGIMETIVGTGVTGFGGDGGPAVSALINTPSTPSFDQAGNLYFYDSNNYRMRRMDTHGIITTIAGDGEPPVPGLDTTGPATSRSIARAGVADVAGNVYISNQQTTSSIWRVTTGGEIELFAQLPDVAGLVTGADGNIYVLSEPFDATVVRISPAGTMTTLVTLPANLPNVNVLVSADAAGNVYLLINGKLNRYAPDGTSTPVATPAGGFNQFAIDSQGNIAALINGTAPTIQTFTPQSVQTIVAGGNPQPAPDGTPLNQAWFLGIGYLAFSHTGDLYGSETGACLIRKISAAQVLSTFAGTGTCGTTAPSGDAKTANISPGSIAVDSQNNVWVAQGTSFIYSIGQNGTIANVMPSPAVQGPVQIAIDGKDRVYVAGRNSLSRLNSGGTWQTITSGSFVFGLGTDAAGNVYLVQGGPNTYVVNDDGSLTLKYPNFGEVSLTFDPAANPWESNGYLTTSNATGIANVGFLTGFSGDGGPAQSAAMETFDSIATGPDGNLYFEEFNRIRRVSGSGPVAAPVISQGGIVNAVNYSGGSIAPGELISIFGANFGVTGLEVSAPVNNTMPFTMGRTKVLFNGQPGAITAITPTQINVFVPYHLASGAPIEVQVQVDNILSGPMYIPEASAAPGISTSILNQDGTVNSAANPAPRGSIVSFYGTGLGAMSPQLNDGNLAISTPYSAPVNSPALSIGGQTALVLYAGDAPLLPTGVFQINAVVPATISPGSVGVSLSVAGASAQISFAVK